ncbi:MAG: outer membrane lipid asymmetry maintenance protein MlaD [bacterium]|nr:outer membrane lipid asymmetry maintenance protein MlaD [bacterium]
MDQSQSNKVKSAAIEIPARTFTVEFYVGIFAIIGVLAAGYLSVGLAGINLGTSDTYTITAEFDNISGLEAGASVEIAGVPVGEVKKIELNDPMAKIIMDINNDVKIKDDDIVSIRTKGIIGDRYVKISRGASDILVPAGGTITETESVLDIEDIVGKFIHSFESKDESKEEVKEQK